MLDLGMKCKNSNKDCEGRAIRIANSKFTKQSGKNVKMNVPEGALTLMSEVSPTVMFSANDTGEEIPKMNILGYSGKAIKDHWYWGDLVINLEGMEFDKKQYPILEDHKIHRKIGFSKKPIIENGALRLDPDTTQFVSTEYADNFIKLSKEGFPFQASISAQPTAVTRYKEGVKFTANGRTFKGPACVWDRCTYREVSVCTFGYDDSTSSSTFNKDVQQTLELSIKESSTELTSPESSDSGETNLTGGKMDLNEFKEKHPELVSQIAAEAAELAKKDADTSLAQTKSQFDQEKTEFAETMKLASQRIAQLEKAEAIRAEKTIKFEADQIWENSLQSSSVATHLHAKVKKMFSHGDFMKDGAFDKEAFTKAVADEIKDWADLEAGSQVLGAGFAVKDAAGSSAVNDSFKKENENVMNLLKKYSGQEDNSGQ